MMNHPVSFVSHKQFFPAIFVTILSLPYGDFSTEQTENEGGYQDVLEALLVGEFLDTAI